MSRSSGLVEVDWNTVAGAQNQPQISHYDPSAASRKEAPDAICGAGAAARTLQHYPAPAASNNDRLGSRQRSMRRPASSAGGKPYSPVAGVSQSFASPLRPMSLLEYQEALKKLSLDDIAVEERIRALTMHLVPEAFQLVEPVRLQSTSARQFIDLVMKIQTRNIRQGLGLSLEEFRQRVRREVQPSSTNAENVLLQMIQELGPQTKAQVKDMFDLRSSMESFVEQLETIELPVGNTIAFTSKYLSKVIDNLCEMDNGVPILPFFDVVQNEVTPKMRCILVEWLFDISTRFKFCQETIFLALALMDRYMMIQRVTRSESQLVAIAALVVAAKYEEVYPPEIKEFAYMTADVFSNTDIIRMERQLFVRLQYGVTVATVNSIATSLLAEQDPRPCGLQAMVVYYLCILVALYSHLGQHSQANLAAAVVYISRIWLNIPTGDLAMDTQKLVPLVLNFLGSVSANSRPGQMIVKHFSTAEQMYISTLAIPDSVKALVGSAIVMV
uniref:Mitotic cyclin n=1 Tax=Bodo saltans TaxID=75058 RepID=B6DTJ6_BODSA|nr:mitotic cyclin [Bodo saltans]